MVFVLAQTSFAREPNGSKAARMASSIIEDCLLGSAKRKFKLRLN